MDYCGTVVPSAELAEVNSAPGAVVAPHHCNCCPASASARPAAMTTRWTPGCSASRLDWPLYLSFLCIALFAECNRFAAGHAPAPLRLELAQPAGRLRDRQIDTYLPLAQRTAAKAMHDCTREHASNAACPATSQQPAQNRIGSTGPPIDAAGSRAKHERAATTRP